MPSSPSNSLRLEEQFTGENVNVWGVLLNQVIAMLDAGVAGMATITLTADYTLTSHNYVADEARNAILKLMGSFAANVTIPSVSKIYVVWNASSALQTITTGSGAAAVIQIGEVALIVCDATNVKRVVATDFAASRLTSVADPLNPQDAATKAYADALAFTANAGILPGQGPGTGGWALFSNGTTALWKQVETSDLGDYPAQFAKTVALAVAL